VLAIPQRVLQDSTFVIRGRHLKRKVLGISRFKGGDQKALAVCGKTVL
jgi:hypothetical protein